MCLCVCSLEKIISEAQRVEAEPCRSLLDNDLNVKRCNEKTIQKLVGNQKYYIILKCIAGVYRNICRLNENDLRSYNSELS